MLSKITKLKKKKKTPKKGQKTEEEKRGRWVGGKNNNFEHYCCRAQCP
jgi:hypothetical protein